MALIINANAQQLQFIKYSIETIHDYPKEGILFSDIKTLLDNTAAYQATIDLLVEQYKGQCIT
ncbi:adenine phosphoribosyltransferase, partial [Proteus mirabilis]|nr:adenine phosphoribosyltransferase [Proteus mirabilis]